MSVSRPDRERDAWDDRALPVTMSRGACEGRRQLLDAALEGCRERLEAEWPSGRCVRRLRRLRHPESVSARSSTATSTWGGDGVSDVLLSKSRGTAWVGFGGAHTPSTFVRGDVDADGSVDLSDAVSALSYLFLGGPPPRGPDAADVYDLGTLDISAPIPLIGFLFLGGEPPAAPYPEPGEDPTADTLARC